MRAKKRLTKRNIDAIRKPVNGRDTYQDEQDPYLHLVVTPTTRSWRYIRKVRGRMVFITLGKSPDLTPDQARAASRQTSVDYSTGKDPQVERQKSKQVTTWSELFDWYLNNYAQKKKKSWETDVRVEGRYCKAWRSKDYRTFTTDMVRRWHKNISDEHGDIAADRAFALVRAVFNRAIKDEMITGLNPTRGVEMNYSDASKYARDRFLDAAEIGRLFKALDEYHDRNMADFFRLCIFTGARRGNVQSMRWEDFNRELATWNIPGLVSKNGKPMTIPLLPEAVEILNRRYDARKSDDWVFPSRRNKPKTPYMAEPKFAWQRICETAGLQGVRMHDLRRTLGSWMAINGVSLAIIGRSLGHKSMQTTEIYARLSDEPVRESMGAAVTKMLAAVNGGED